MSNLSPETRVEIEALLARSDISTAEIAARTGASPGTVRALKAWRRMRSSTDSDAVAEAEVIDSLETTFGLERDLQLALRSHIQQLDQDLMITDDGKERTVPSGRIDILAKDERDVAVVIELKAGTADRDAIGQILSYMGDVQSGGGGGAVRGIVVAADFTPRAIAAAKAAQNISLRKYAFKFTFEAVS